MQALLLAANAHSRIPPLTDSLPGPLLSIVDRPVISMAIELLARAGMKRIGVGLSRNGGAIAAALGSGNRWGVSLDYMAQQAYRGSAGMLAWIAHRIEDTLIVLPGDAIIDLDIAAALTAHRAHGGPVTLIAHVEASRSAGAWVRTNDAGCVVAWGETAPPTDTLALSGAVILEPAAIHALAIQAEGELEPALLRTLPAAGMPLRVYAMSDYWNPLDTLERYQEAQTIYLNSAYQRSLGTPPDAGRPLLRHAAPSGRQVAPGIWIGPNDSIHPSAQLAPPLFIGAGCWIGSAVELGPYTVIGPHVIIDDEATVAHSTILRETYIGRVVKINERLVQGATLIDPAHAAVTQVADPFLLAHTRDIRPVHRQRRRSLGTLVAALLLAAFSPALLVIWLVNLVWSRGRPLETHVMVGGRAPTDDAVLQQVRLFRFRTRNASGDYTLIGRWLERWDLHRLPELINVVRGDLNLVGVMPLTAQQATALTETWQQQRHAAAAGFTGLWYVQAEPDSPLDVLLVADVYYAAMPNWRHNLTILAQTPAAWWRRSIAQRRTTPAIAQTDLA